MTSKRLPPSLPPWEAQLIVKGRVDAIVKQYREAEDQRRKQADDERRTKKLIAHGNNRAQSKTITGWDTSEAERARREVERALKDEVEADWTEGDVDDLVDDVLAEWDDDDEEDEGEDADGDYEEDDDREEDE